MSPEPTLAPSSQDRALNLDRAVVDSFGDEWTRFDQSALSRAELLDQFDGYFNVFPWERLGSDAAGMDVGCGSGRWAQLVAPRVGTLHCIDASEGALAVARRNLAAQPNCWFTHASVQAIPIPDGTLDFGYCLGVLHHIPDTQAGLNACIAKLKPGAPFLVYLYYALDGRPSWFKALWRLSDALRRMIAHSPDPIRFFVCDLIAAAVYWPLSRFARLMERLGHDVSNLPLSPYRHRAYYSLRTDALDRFGTRLEQRFSRDQVEAMMKAAGLANIRFSARSPFWCAVGLKA